MTFSDKYSKAFQQLLPSPFTIAILLTVLAFFSSLFFTKPDSESLASYSIEILSFWEKGLWNNGLMVFAMQMMLMLVLGHTLALTPFADKVISTFVRRIKSTSQAVLVISFTTILVALFNWGLGLIFGAIFARKVGEYASQNKMALNYPLVGAAGYSGLMVWHGGISGSSLIKVSENSHLKEMMVGMFDSSQIDNLPDNINFSQTVFSSTNLICILLLLLIIPCGLSLLAKQSRDSIFKLREKAPSGEIEKYSAKGAEVLDHSIWLSKSIGLIFLLYSFYLMFSPSSFSLNFITPNFINFTLLGLTVFLHKNFYQLLSAFDKAILGASGILIQFPLYFGIMGIMKSSGLVNEVSAFFVSISSPQTFPIFTFFSAALVNIFVPSGGGQWAIQGPIIIQASHDLGISLPKSILALAYGDQLTNMLQPFWALPLLGITGLKAKEILPYTLFLFCMGLFIFLLVLIFF